MDDIDNHQEKKIAEPPQRSDETSQHDTCTVPHFRNQHTVPASNMGIPSPGSSTIGTELEVDESCDKKQQFQNSHDDLKQAQGNVPSHVPMLDRNQANNQSNSDHNNHISSRSNDHTEENDNSDDYISQAPEWHSHSKISSSSHESDLNFRPDDNIYDVSGMISEGDDSGSLQEQEREYEEMDNVFEARDLLSAQGSTERDEVSSDEQPPWEDDDQHMRYAGTESLFPDQPQGTQLQQYTHHTEPLSHPEPLHREQERIDKIRTAIMQETMNRLRLRFDSENELMQEQIDQLNITPSSQGSSALNIMERWKIGYQYELDQIIEMGSSISLTTGMASSESQLVFNDEPPSPIIDRHAPASYGKRSSDSTHFPNEVMELQKSYRVTPLQFKEDKIEHDDMHNTYKRLTETIDEGDLPLTSQNNSPNSGLFDHNQNTETTDVQSGEDDDDDDDSDDNTEEEKENELSPKQISALTRVERIEYFKNQELRKMQKLFKRPSSVTAVQKSRKDATVPRIPIHNPIQRDTSALFPVDNSTTQDLFTNPSESTDEHDSYSSISSNIIQPQHMIAPQASRRSMYQTAQHAGINVKSQIPARNTSTKREDRKALISQYQPRYGLYATTGLSRTQARDHSDTEKSDGDDEYKSNDENAHHSRSGKFSANNNSSSSAGWSTGSTTRLSSSSSTARSRSRSTPSKSPKPKPKPRPKPKKKKYNISPRTGRQRAMERAAEIARKEREKREIREREEIERKLRVEELAQKQLEMVRMARENAQLKKVAEELLEELSDEYSDEEFEAQRQQEEQMRREEERRRLREARRRAAERAAEAKRKIEDRKRKEELLRERKIQERFRKRDENIQAFLLRQQEQEQQRAKEQRQPQSQQRHAAEQQPKERKVKLKATNIEVHSENQNETSQQSYPKQKRVTNEERWNVPQSEDVHTRTDHTVESRLPTSNSKLSLPEKPAQAMQTQDQQQKQTQKIPKTTHPEPSNLPGAQNFRPSRLKQPNRRINASQQNPISSERIEPQSQQQEKNADGSKLPRVAFLNKNQQKRVQDQRDSEEDPEQNRDKTQRFQKRSKKTYPVSSPKPSVSPSQKEKREQQSQEFRVARAKLRRQASQANGVEVQVFYKESHPPDEAEQQLHEDIDSEVKEHSNQEQLDEPDFGYYQIQDSESLPQENTYIYTDEGQIEYAITSPHPKSPPSTMRNTYDPTNYQTPPPSTISMSQLLAPMSSSSLRLSPPPPEDMMHFDFDASMLDDFAVESMLVTSATLDPKYSTPESSDTNQEDSEHIIDSTSIPSSSGMNRFGFRRPPPPPPPP